MEMKRIKIITPSFTSFSYGSRFYDADTGEEITYVKAFTVYAQVRHQTEAELTTMVTDANGEIVHDALLNPKLITTRYRVVSIEAPPECEHPQCPPNGAGEMSGAELGRVTRP